MLVDEEWPHGALHGFRGPFLIGAGYRQGSVQSGFHGQIDHLALWDRALSDEEIATLSGGEAEIARRTQEFLGPENPSLQYWRPRGFNTFVGDCMPAYYDGEFHFHYLFDRHHGALQVGYGRASVCACQLQRPGSLDASPDGRQDHGAIRVLNRHGENRSTSGNVPRLLHSAWKTLLV